MAIPSHLSEIFFKQKCPKIHKPREEIGVCKTVFFQMYIGGFGGRKNKNWTDHLVPRGDFVL